MPTYEITAPDGRKYRINAPEGATKEQALAYAKQQLSGAPNIGGVAAAPQSEPMGSPPPVQRSNNASRRTQFEQHGDPDIKRWSNPTGTGYENWAAGMGSGFTSAYRGAQQVGAGIADFVNPRDGQSRYDEISGKVAEQRQVDAPLMQTEGGKAGNVTAAAATMIAPGSLAKAAGAPAGITRAMMPTSVKGAAGQGAAYGAIQPALSGEERAANIAAGTAGGAVGGKVANTISSFAKPVPRVDPQRAAAIEAARKAGYVLPPSEVGTKGVLRAVEGLSGKAQIENAFSSKNQLKTNAIARQALGLPDDAPLNLETLQAVRDQAADVYRQVGAAGEVKPNLSYFRALNNLTKDARTAAKSFAKAKPSPVFELIEELKTPAFDARAGLAKIRELRNQADKAYRQGDNELGRASKKAAGILEDAIENHLRQSGNKEGLAAFREARKLIAKTYTVQKALNPETGNVSARVIGQLKKKGKPLSDGLDTIGTVGASFENAVKDLKSPYRPLSAVDFLSGMAGSAIDPTLVTAIAARPAARAALATGPMQNMLARQATQGYSIIPPLPAVARNSASVRRLNSAQRRALPAAGYGLLTDEKDRWR